MKRVFVAFVTTALATAAFTSACAGSDFATGLRTAAPADGGFGASMEAPGASDGKAFGPADNAVILVHAAGSQPFRLCFKNELDRRPQPDSQAMPEANVVGVEVGSAVRLGPLRGAAGEVFLFEESAIRALYPAFGVAGPGPTCGQLLTGTWGSSALSLGTINADLSRGVHLLVVRGCPFDVPLRKHTVAECGADWEPTKSNLSIQEVTLAGTNRPSASTLPAQVVNLSQPLETLRAGRDLVVSFGAIAAANSEQAEVTTNPKLFGNASPVEPVRLAFEVSDAGVYETLGVRVRLVGRAADGGANGPETVLTVLDESLAKIQKSSSPRDVPPSYFAAASNYALLLLGDPGAKLPDGGRDDDDRRTLHVLAVPVVEPKADAGSVAESGNGTQVDGGSTNPP